MDNNLDEETFIKIYEHVVHHIEKGNRAFGLEKHEEFFDFLKEILNRKEIKYTEGNILIGFNLDQFTEEELKHIKNVYDLFYRR